MLFISEGIVGHTSIISACNMFHMKHNGVVKQEKQKTEKQIVGQKGEEIAVKRFVKQNYEILDRNYRKKWGELDIVVKKDGVIHFIEVKAEKISSLGVLHVKHFANPEENVHYWKRQRLARAIQTWLLDHRVSHETTWQVDVMAVFLDFNKKVARVRITEDISLD